MQSNSLPAWLSYLLEWAHQEQALIAGLLALLGAWLTVWQIRKQIAVQQAQWEYEKAQRQKSSRARLPLALSEIVDYCLNSYSICRQMFCRYEDYKKNGLIPPTLARLPSHALEVLAEGVRDTQHEDVSAALIEILSEIQSVSVRVRNSVDTVTSNRTLININNREAFALRAVELEELRARTEGLFEYARFEREDVRPLRGKVEALKTYKFGNVEDEFRQQVAEYIETRWPE
ncbi:MAG: hypothetical protein R3C54_05400 [Parvularculaceae bacterium]